MRKTLKSAAKVFVILNIFIVLLALVTKIPASSVYDNCKKSVYMIHDEEKIIKTGPFNLYRDANADAVEMNIMMHNDNTLKAYYYGNGSGQYLPATLNWLDEKTGKKISYFQYWHGYQILFKPFLLFMNIKQIRFMYMILYAVGLIWLLYKMTKKKDYFLAGILAVLNLVFVIPAGFISLEYIPVMLLMFVLSAWCYLKKDIYASVFVFAGAATVFFDFLTAETLVFTVPMLILLYKNRAGIKKTIKYGICFAASYVGMIMYKLVIMSVLYGKNYFVEYADTFNKHFSSTPKTMFFVNYTISENFQVVNISHGLLIFAAIAVITYILRSTELNFGSYVALLLIGTVPFLRYAVLLDHSRILYYFTYKALMGTLFSEAICIKSCVKGAGQVALEKKKHKKKS